VLIIGSPSQARHAIVLKLDTGVGVSRVLGEVGRRLKPCRERGLAHAPPKHLWPAPLRAWAASVVRTTVQLASVLSGMGVDELRLLVFAVLSIDDVVGVEVGSESAPHRGAMRLRAAPEPWLLADAAALARVYLQRTLVAAATSSRT
jgi:hypothetical protein